MTRLAGTCLSSKVLLSLLVAASGVLPGSLAGARDVRSEAESLGESPQLTRSDLAQLYVSLSGASFQPPACVPGQEMFTDVPALSPFCSWIEELARRGITGGCGGGNFCPASPVTRAQMATFIIKAWANTEDCNAGLASNDEMVRVGSVCIEKYEASIWTKRIGGSRITGPIPCAANGQNCEGKIFARSVAGVPPRDEITWFQAQAALENSGKRLPTSAEWQMAMAGTPDGSPCIVSSSGPSTTGSQPGCVSDHGVFDMVGNVTEWVADWVPLSTAGPGWGTFSDDQMWLSGASTTAPGPGAVSRGGHFKAGSNAGPFAVDSFPLPYESFAGLGFRGAR